MTTLPTPAELDRLRELEKAATPGPWFIEGSHMDYAIMGNRTGSQDGWAIAENVIDLDARRKDADRQARDADLILGLRNAAPSLLLAASAAITLEAQMAKVREFLRDGERVRELMTGSDAYSPANDDRITDALSELLATLAKETKDG